MKLAYLTPQYPKVSHTFIRREIRELCRRGHEVRRLSIRSPESAVVDPADIEEEALTLVLLEQGATRLAMSVLRCAARAPGAVLREVWRCLDGWLRRQRGLVRPVAYLVEAAFVAQLCRREAIEHVHVHFGTNAATVAAIAERLGGPGFSMTLHGPDEWDAPEAIGLPERLRAARFTAVISSYAAAQARRWLAPAHWDRVHVVRCALDASFAAARAPVPAAPTCALSEGAARFVCVGRLTPQKGQLLLIDAIAALRARGVDAQLVLAGDGELREGVEARIAAADLSDRVTITGWIDEARVRREVLAAHCFVLPSFAEGLPVVIMEAFALGRPVISTWVAGIPELVRPGENGWLVPPASLDALTDAMHEAAALSPEALDAMGEAGAKRVAERHDIGSEAGRLEALIATCVGRCTAQERD